MATLQQLRTRLRTYIDQTAAENSDYSDNELTGFLNEGQTWLAALVKWPRDLIEIQAEVGKDTYTLPSDNMMIMDAFFGNRDEAGDMQRLTVTTPQLFFENNPSWLDNTSGARGRPTKVMMIDRQSILIAPKPDSTNSATGKKIYVYYIYYPTAMSSDSDTPDIPLAFHDFLVLYGAHLAYMGKLNNPVLAKAILQDILDKVKLVEQPTTQEINQLYFGFGSDDDFDSPTITDIDPS